MVNIDHGERRDRRKNTHSARADNVCSPPSLTEPARSMKNRTVSGQKASGKEETTMLSPFRGFRDMQSEMERLMSEAFGAFGRQPSRRAAVEEWTPVIDAKTSDGDLVIRAELPGLKREDVDVTVSNGVLTISGERKEEEREEKESGYLLRERRYGSFRRSMTLPEGTNESKVKARFEDGLLEVRVEGGGRELPEPKRIEIEE